ncbi:MAG: universal stress protein [Pseudomonadota bacterium]
MKIDKILVPVDFSEFSDKAVAHALFWAQRYCAEITLVHAVVLFEENFDKKERLAAYESVVEKKEKEQAAKMDSRCKAARESGVDTVHSALLRGFNTADVILDHLNANDYDLVVMGTHGFTGLKHLVLGSTAEKVVRFSPVPVLTIHKDFKGTAPQKILVPVDFSKHSAGAVRQAMLIAGTFNARPAILHVVRYEMHPMFYNVSTKPLLVENPQLREHILKHLEELAQLPEGEADYEVIEGKSVHMAVKEYAEDNNIDLIVMPSRGMNDLEDLFMGSTTERVVRVAPCPVLTFRTMHKP